MEHERRLSPCTLLLEARHELRKYLALETMLIEQITRLPEDDFCHNARESLQLGAGYAYIRLSNDADFVISTTHNALDPVSLRDAHDTYFSLQPQNKYEPESVTRDRRKSLSDASLTHLSRRPRLDSESSVDPYELASLTAFTQGFITVIHHLHIAGRDQFPRAELA